jgi:hypothetical protein
MAERSEHEIAHFLGSLMLHPGLSMEVKICHNRRQAEAVWNDRNQWS